MTDFVISYRLPLRRQIGMIRTFGKHCAVSNDNFFAATKTAVHTKPLIHLSVEWHKSTAHVVFASKHNAIQAEEISQSITVKRSSDVRKSSTLGPQKISAS